MFFSPWYSGSDARSRTILRCWSDGGEEGQGGERERLKRPSFRDQRHVQRRERRIALEPIASGEPPVSAKVQVALSLPRAHAVLAIGESSIRPTMASAPSNSSPDEFVTVSAAARYAATREDIPRQARRSGTGIVGARATC
jgi:hypothetical protein